MPSRNESQPDRGAGVPKSRVKRVNVEERLAGWTLIAGLQLIKTEVHTSSHECSFVQIH